MKLLLSTAKDDLIQMQENYARVFASLKVMSDAIGCLQFQIDCAEMEGISEFDPKTYKHSL